ncbi:MAG TPA: hypothetical protein VIW67_12300 [Terriglobales bacterium]|jgi:hypothetical protein
MNTHPYLRAYMAGIVAPSLGLLIALTAFILTRLVFHVPIPLERVIIFPMALVPNAFGLWNIFYVWTRPHRHWPIGFHGTLLPIFIVTLGGFLATSGGFLTVGAKGVTWFQTINVPYSLFGIWFLGALVVYYLVWKYVVGFLNQVLGVA